MTLRILVVLLLATALPACHRLPEPLRPAAAADLGEARAALHGGSFARADRLLSRLAAEEPGSRAGREALFLLGVLHLDPRNPAASAAEAEQVLDRYLALGDGVERRAEAVSLFALSRRLAEEPALAPEVADGGAVDGGAAPAGAADDVEALRGELAARDREIARLRDELARIRRTLAPPGR